LPAKVIESNTVNGFKNQLNSPWKDLEIKFKPDIYKPEVTNGYDKSRRVAGANKPKFMTSTPGKTETLGQRLTSIARSQRFSLGNTISLCITYHILITGTCGQDTASPLFSFFSPISMA
jgi:hypothetical protein